MGCDHSSHLAGILLGDSDGYIQRSPFKLNLSARTMCSCCERFHYCAPLFRYTQCLYVHVSHIAHPSTGSPLADKSIFICRSCGRLFRANGFLLSMASPVLHKMLRLFGDFREGAARRMVLEDVDGRVFGDVLDLWCGKEVRGETELGYAMMMASVADRLQMVEAATCLLYTSPSPRDGLLSRMPSSA